MKISVLTPTIRPDGLKIVQESLEKQTIQDFEWLVEIGITGKGHDLNAAYNRMLRRAKGELIVSLQDYTQIPSDGLEKFWKAYQEHPRTFWTAPHGKTLDFKEITWDWRNRPAVKPQYRHWEIDWAAAPLSALKEIGGFDEELDLYWSCDNLNVAYRAELAGYEFGNLIDNPAVALDHDKLFPHPFRKQFFPEFNSQRLAQFDAGLKLNYLDGDVH